MSMKRKLLKTWRNIRWKIAFSFLTENETKLLYGIYTTATKEFRMTDNTDQLIPGKEVYIRAVIDEVVDDFITCQNNNGYYYTVTRDEIAVRQYGHWENGVCSECNTKSKKETRFCPECGAEMKLAEKGKEDGKITEG